MQHALPTTFGVKVAGWLDAMNRHSEAAGRNTRESAGLAIWRRSGDVGGSQENGLQWHRHWRVSFNWPSPSPPWHAHRDRVAEVATTLGLLVGTLGKIARDISLHNANRDCGSLRTCCRRTRWLFNHAPQRNPVSAGVVLSAATPRARIG